MENSSESENCFSDGIDSETEVSLYSAIHHDFNQSFDDNFNIDSHFDNCINDSNVNQSEEPFVEYIAKSAFNLNKTQTQTSFHFKNNSPSKAMSISNKRNIECIQIDDSSDDSDIQIIDEKQRNRFSKTKNQFSKAKNQKKRINKNKRSLIASDISLANVNNLNESILSSMDQFYNEDNHDSEQEMQTFNNMSNDKNLWKINYNDILLSSKKSNRYYRNRFICNNCSERGHQARDCPLPKKSPTCYLCGRSGHRSSSCQSIVCSKCYDSNHKTTNCNVLMNQLVCDVCGVRGHDTNQCTYIWRKYHSITTLEDDSQSGFANIEVNRRVSCYNCGAIGKHFGHECRSKGVSPAIAASPLMVISKKGRCLNEKASNRSDHSIYNGYNGMHSSNELSCSGSFDRTLSEFDFSNSSSYATISSQKSSGSQMSAIRQNKHMKWIYPETNSTPIMKNNETNLVIGQEKAILSDRKVSYSGIALVMNCETARHEMPHNEHHISHRIQQINNSMLEKSQTTPKRSQTKNRHKSYVQSYESLEETNVNQNKIKSKKLRERKIRRRINRRLNKKFRNIQKSNNINNSNDKFEKSRFMNNERIGS